MSLPKLTHLQYLVISLLGGGEMSGRDLRAQLKKEGELRTAPAFYQLLGRLEECGLVEGRFEEHVIEGQRIKEKHYKVTGAGARAWRGAFDFYSGRSESLPQWSGVPRR